MNVKRKRPSEALLRKMAAEEKREQSPKRKSYATRAPWDTIRAEYVGGKSKVDIVEKYGVHPRTLDQRIARGKWSLARQMFLRKVSEEVEKATLEATSQARQDALKLTHGIKTQIARRLLDSLKNDKTYRVTPRDYDVITRLEQDLREPGWKDNPSTGGDLGSGPITVNVLIQKLEGVLDREAVRRTEAASAPKLPAEASTALASFLVGGNGPGSDPNGTEGGNPTDPTYIDLDAAERLPGRSSEEAPE